MILQIRVVATAIKRFVRLRWCMAKKVKNSGTRRFWFKCVKVFLKLIIKKPKYVFLGEEGFAEKCIVLSNHVAQRESGE